MHEQEHAKLFSEGTAKEKEILQLRQTLFEKEKELKEANSELERRRMEMVLASETKSSLSKELEDCSEKDIEGNDKCERLKVLEEQNEQLRNSLARLADDYSKDLPSIFNEFETMTKELKEGVVLKAVNKEFDTLDNFIQETQYSLPKIAKNCMKIIQSLNTLRAAPCSSKIKVVEETLGRKNKTDDNCRNGIKKGKEVPLKPSIKQSKDNDALNKSIEEKMVCKEEEASKFLTTKASASEEIVHEDTSISNRKFESAKNETDKLSETESTKADTCTQNETQAKDADSKKAQINFDFAEIPTIRNLNDEYKGYHTSQINTHRFHNNIKPNSNESIPSNPTEIKSFSVTENKTQASDVEIKASNRQVDVVIEEFIHNLSLGSQGRTRAKAFESSSGRTYDCETIKTILNSTITECNYIKEAASKVGEGAVEKKGKCPLVKSMTPRETQNADGKGKQVSFLGIERKIIKGKVPSKGSAESSNVETDMYFHF
eukprot:TRINITY_DN537_c0_g1_i6.p1 TRINITY_DN537_c0_g1~~TRINITY_DN537_c0_g1_i6.p1  ORF type:complete len:489 (+),score=89.75 TRINITY_DN537_c0_g1_i6:429-1895(+)